VPAHSFIQPGAFKPKVIAVMTEALEAACKALDDTRLSEAMREDIARRIVSAATFGKREPMHFRAAALAGYQAKSTSPFLVGPRITNPIL
jgi:hypothetical protein